MKKLLSLLSIMTITGTAMPMVIAAAPYQKKEHTKLNRTKRKVHPSRLDIQYDWGSTWNKMIATFSPAVFNDIRRHYECANTFDEFKALFGVEMYTGIWKDHRVENNGHIYLPALAKCIWNNWETIKTTFTNGAIANGKNNYSIIITCWASNGSFIETAVAN